MSQVKVTIVDESEQSNEFYFGRVPIVGEKVNYPDRTGEVVDVIHHVYPDVGVKPVPPDRKLVTVRLVFRVAEQLSSVSGIPRERVQTARENWSKIHGTGDVEIIGNRLQQK